LDERKEAARDKSNELRAANKRDYESSPTFEKVLKPLPTKRGFLQDLLRGVEKNSNFFYSSQQIL
jgi:hypothetical protein